MTTTLIASTSSAAPLRERAIAEYYRRVAANDEQAREEARHEFQRRVDVLFIHLRDRLGMHDRESVKLSELTSHAPGGFTATTADGLRFTLKDLPYSEGYRDRERLHVAVTCSRGCGKDLWVHVESLEDLGAAIHEDATHTHDFSCLQKFDEYGDPITDRMGNPLPPPNPPTPSAYERSKLAADEIERAGQLLAASLNIVSEMEDSRALAKRDAIQRLLESGAYTSATAAEKYVEQDAEYMAYRQMQRNAEVTKHGAMAYYEAAIIRARLALEVFIAEERNR